MRYHFSLPFSKQQNAKENHNAKIVKYPQATPPQHNALSLRLKRRFGKLKRRDNFTKRRFMRGESAFGFCVFRYVFPRLCSLGGRAV